jgi:hypothetical protein
VPARSPDRAAFESQAGIVIVLILFSVVFAIVGCFAVFAPRTTAQYLKRRDMPVRIGSTVETTPRNVRTVGIVFLVIAIALGVLGVLVVVGATVPGLQLPFAQSPIGAEGRRPAADRYLVCGRSGPSSRIATRLGGPANARR